MSGVHRRASRPARRVLVAALVLSLVLPAPAFAGPILPDDDAAELAQKLAEATEEQDICYGWEMTVRDERGGYQDDAGSSSGPGSPLDRRACRRWIVLAGSVSYTPASSEQEDSASLRIETSFVGGPHTSDLPALGVSERDLLGDRDDIALFNAVSGLPLLAAQYGHAPYVAAESNAEPIPSGDQPTGKPSFDVGRTYAPLIVLLVLAMIAGAAGIVLTLAGVLPRTPRPPVEDEHASTLPRKAT